jgi:hypothetical protein
MYKVLILIVGFYTAAVRSDNAEDVCSLDVQPLGYNRLSFFYTPQYKTDKAYFYVKAMTENENPEKTVEAIMATGEKLEFVESSIARYYQAPEQAKKLYIVKAKSRLTDVDPSAQVIPEVNDVEKNRHQRNVSIYPHLLLPETKKLANGEDVSICELLL